MSQTTNVKPAKLDLRKQYRELYSPSARFVQIVDVPELLYLALDGGLETGVGPGDSPDFAGSMGAMYGVGYGLKFMSKLRADTQIDYKLMAVEGLWSLESGRFEWGRAEPWLYTLLMMQPEHITQQMFAEAVSQTAAKRANPALGRLRLERWEEGLSIQILHIGPYSEEPRTVEMMDAFAEENGLELHGRHHEIYLGDPTKAKPENLKTILRHPVRTPG